MNSEQQQDESAVNQAVWRRYGVFVALAAVSVIALYYETALSMATIWYRSETFAHGFLIVPMAAWLVWEKKHHLLRLMPRPDYRVLLLTLPLGFGWLLGYLVDVLVVQQFAFVGLLILLIWTLLGNRVALFLGFPLGFLFLAVPVGEGLIPPMMDFTTDFTVWMLRLTGLPVFREGTFFSIPSGDWSVVEGCSGVRYLIASVTLGVLYAYLTYQKLHKRIIFTIFSIIVPIIANGLRAYMIVMIAHLSDMKLALGVDHFIYGWVFFGIVVTIMFVVGAFWRDPAPEIPALEFAQPGSDSARLNPLTATLIGLSVVAVWPLTAYALSQQSISNTLSAPLTVNAADIPGFTPSATDAWDWEPQIINPDARFKQFYNKQGVPYALYLSLYVSQRQDAELVNSQNVMVRQKHPIWVNKGRTTARIDLHGQATQVGQAKMASARQRMLVWHWYRIGERYTSNKYLAKLLEASARLFGGRRDAAFITVTTQMDERTEVAVPRLQAFVDAMLPEIEKALDRTVGRG